MTYIKQNNFSQIDDQYLNIMLNPLFYFSYILYTYIILPNILNAFIIKILQPNIRKYYISNDYFIYIRIKLLIFVLYYYPHELYYLLLFRDGFIPNYYCLKISRYIVYYENYNQKELIFVSKQDLSEKIHIQLYHLFSIRLKLHILLVRLATYISLNINHHKKIYY